MRLLSFLLGTALLVGISGARSETPHTNSALDPLTGYIENFRRGRASFIPSLNGEDAGRQLSANRLFASAYEEVIFSTKLREKNGVANTPDTIIADFERILVQEREVERLMFDSPRHRAAIAYLRALQNGDVIFPPPAENGPIPDVLLAQVQLAYPEATFGLQDAVFAEVYRKVRGFAAWRLQKSGSVSIYEIIGEYRRLLIEP